jgi:hypothetical protein
MYDSPDATAMNVVKNRRPLKHSTTPQTVGSFHTSERRGGVERRQVELKGVEGGD